MKNLKKQKLVINGDQIFLRCLEESNATKEYSDWLNDSEVNRYLTTKSATTSGLKKYIKEKNKDPNCLFFGIFFKKNKKHIGNIKLEPINFKDYEATIGIMIGDKDYWGRGIGTEAIRLLTNYAFQKIGLEEINLGVVSKNKVAIKAYKNVGFKIDKIEKKAVRYGDTTYDQLIMSIKNFKIKT